MLDKKRKSYGATDRLNIYIFYSEKNIDLFTFYENKNVAISIETFENDFKLLLKISEEF